jgi:hypothetical protein
MEIDPFKDQAFKSYEEKTCLKMFKRKFRLLDLYALPVTFRYKGEKKFYTNAGALTSLLIIICTLGLLYSELNSMFSKSKPPNIQIVSKFYTDRVHGGMPADFIFGIRVQNKG